MKWRSHHVNAIRSQEVILVWNSRRCEFSHVNTPNSEGTCCTSKDVHWTEVTLPNFCFSSFFWRDSSTCSILVLVVTSKWKLHFIIYVSFTSFEGKSLSRGYLFWSLECPVNSCATVQSASFEGKCLFRGPLFWSWECPLSVGPAI